MSEGNYKVIKVSFRLNSGHIWSCNVTARNITEAQNNIIEYFNSKNIGYTSVHSKVLNERPMMPETVYINKS